MPGAPSSVLVPVHKPLGLLGVGWPRRGPVVDSCVIVRHLGERRRRPDWPWDVRLVLRIFSLRGLK